MSRRRGISLPAPVRGLPRRDGTTRFRWDISWPKIRSRDKYSSYRPRDPAGVAEEGPGTSLGVSGPRGQPRDTTTMAPLAPSDSLTTPDTLTLMHRHLVTWRNIIII